MRATRKEGADRDRPTRKPIAPAPAGPLEPSQYTPRLSLIAEFGSTPYGGISERVPKKFCAQFFGCVAYGASYIRYVYSTGFFFHGVLSTGEGGVFMAGSSVLGELQSTQLQVAKEVADVVLRLEGLVEGLVGRLGGEVRDAGEDQAGIRAPVDGVLREMVARERRTLAVLGDVTRLLVRLEGELVVGASPVGTSPVGASPSSAYGWPADGWPANDWPANEAWMVDGWSDALLAAIVEGGIDGFVIIGWARAEDVTMLQGAATALEVADLKVLTKGTNELMLRLALTMLPAEARE